MWRWHCGLLSISLETNPFVILVLQLQLCVIFVTLPSSIDQQQKAPLPLTPLPPRHTHTHTHTRRLAHTESVHAFCCLIRRHYQDRMKLAIAAVVAGAIISTHPIPPPTPSPTPSPAPPGSVTRCVLPVDLARFQFQAMGSAEIPHKKLFSSYLALILHSSFCFIHCHSIPFIPNDRMIVVSFHLI